MDDNNPISVSDACSLIESTVDGSPVLHGMYIVGEIFRVSPSHGHYYFDLKDRDARLSCVLFRGRATRSKALPSEGKTMAVRGSVNFYKPYGQLKCIVESIEDFGLGALYARFVALKQRLGKEGLFDISKKKQIPSFPKTVAIVTSREGAALQDILNQFINRNPFVELLIVPTRVQGAGAHIDISKALRKADSCGADAVILARGGGSIEDLWAFNEEEVARTIASMVTPVVCGVGHEIDHTIAEYAADVAATTPTQAALLCTRSAFDDLDAMAQMLQRMTYNIRSLLRDRRNRIENLSLRIDRRAPMSLVEAQQQKTAYLAGRLDASFMKIITEKRSRADALKSSLEALNPSAIMQRGYSLAFGKEGLIRSVEDVSSGEDFILMVRDGRVSATVKEKVKKDGR